MVSKKNKLLDASKKLEQALAQYQAQKSELNFLTVTKAFEIAIEYAWREIKYIVEDQGLEAPAPKLAIKQAAKIGIIIKPELWLDCIEARNNSVHDYFGISEDEFIELASELLALIPTIQKK